MQVALAVRRGRHICPRTGGGNWNESYVKGVLGIELGVSERAADTLKLFFLFNHLAISPNPKVLNSPTAACYLVTHGCFCTMAVK